MLSDALPRFKKSKHNEAGKMVRRIRFQEIFFFLMEENRISRVISHHKSV